MKLGVYQFTSTESIDSNLDIIISRYQTVSTDVFNHDGNMIAEAEQNNKDY